MVPKRGRIVAAPLPGVQGQGKVRRTGASGRWANIRKGCSPSDRTPRWPGTCVTPSATMLLAIVERTGLLPCVISGVLESANPSFGIVFLEGCTFTFQRLLAGLGRGGRTRLRPIRRRDGIAMFFLVCHVRLPS